MSNINLYQSEQANEKTPRSVFLDKGLIIGVLVLVIVLAGYGGLEMYLRSLDQKIADLKSEQLAGQGLFKKQDANLAASFQQRLERLESDKGAFEKNDPDGVWRAVQGAMIPGAVASQIGFQEKALNISFVADDFEVLARQIMSFKKSAAFQNVEVKSSVRGESGKVNAELAMTLNL